MKGLGFAAPVAVCALVSALAGCSGADSVEGMGTVPSAPKAATATHRHSWMTPAAASGDLLYISDPGYGAVFVYTYSPFGMKFVGMLAEPQNPGPLCVDKQQNVWVLSGAGEGSFAATEYAHGGTEPVAVLVDPAGSPTGCAVDPINGTLALGSTPSHSGQYATIALFKHERGKPTLVTDPSIPGFYTCCTYDNKGDLFGYGTEDQQGHNIIAELPRGSTSFTGINLGREISTLRGMQWDGKYLTVGDSDGSVASIIRYEITPSGGKERGSTPLTGVSLLWQYYIDGNRIIAPDAPFVGQGGFVGLFHYPAGGTRIRVRRFSEPVAVVVSRAPHV